MADASAPAHYHSQPIFDARGDLYFSRSGWDYRGHSEHVSRWDGTRYGPADTSAAWLALRVRLLFVRDFATIHRVPLEPALGPR